MAESKEKNFTVQGVGSPVPATLLSDRAGSQSSRYNYRNSTSVEDLAVVGDILQEPKQGVVAKNTVVEAFAKSSKVARSPQKIMVAQTPCLLDGPSTIAKISPNMNVNREDLTNLGRKIKDLLDFITPKSNVHQEIKRLVNTITTLHRRIVNTEVVNDVQITQATQTTPKEEFHRNQDISNRFETPTGNNRRKRHRKKSSPHVSEEKINKRVKPAETQSVTVPILQRPKQKKPMSEELLPEDQNISIEGNEWVPVRRKERKRIQQSRRRPISDALLIKTNGSMSYADILKKVKEDPSLKSMGEKVVSQIRRTKAGELLLRLNTVNEPQSLEFTSAVAVTLGATAEVKHLTNEMMVEILDLDEITTEEEICNAIVNQFNETAKVRSLRTSYGKTQTATISLPVISAQKLLKAGKVRVGWVSCRIREKIALLKCFKCLSIGHFVRDCKSEKDYSKTCYKCGEKDHIAKTCKSEPDCIVCKDLHSSSDVKHMAGSAKCPTYQNSLQKFKRK